MKNYLPALASPLLFVSATALAKTRYSGEFNYQGFEPSTVYFHGTAAQG